MQLTKKSREDLSDVLRRLELAENFISDNDHKICSIARSALNSPNYYTNNAGETIQEITKFYGSELMQLKNAIDKLKIFLKENE